MSNQSNYIEPIRRYLADHPDHGERRISKALGIPKGTVSRLLKNHFSHGRRVLLGVAGGITLGSAKELLERIIESKPSRTVQSLDDLLREAKVDLKEWMVDHHIVNSYEMGYKDEAGRAHKLPLFQVKAWLKRRPGPPDSEVLKQLWEQMRKDPLPQARVPKAPKAWSIDRADRLLEISIPDLHLGALAWGKETGEDYDSAIAEKRFLDSVRDLVAKGSVFGFSRILFPVGSDFFHTDTPEGSTAAGTRVDVDTRWQRSFVHGVRILRKAIELLRTYAPVDIVVISGNHDTARAFYLGEVLSAAYEKCPDVKVDNGPATRKYYRWGTVLLGLAHGDKVKYAALPNLMAGEARHLWAETTHHEWHVGHLHHSKEHWFEAGREQNATRIRVLPSLAGTDAWHAQQGYIGARKAAEAYLWSKAAGYVGHFNFTAR